MWGGIILPTVVPYSLFTQQSACKLFRTSQVLFNQLPPHCSGGGVVSASMCFQPCVNPTGFQNSKGDSLSWGQTLGLRCLNMARTPRSPGRSPSPMLSPSSSVSPGKGMRPDPITFPPFLPYSCGSFLTTLAVEELFCLSPSCFQ